MKGDWGDALHIVRKAKRAEAWSSGERTCIGAASTSVGFPSAGSFPRFGHDHGDVLMDESYEVPVIAP